MRIDCDKYKECLENKLFHPFCYRIGPSEDERFRITKGYKYQKSGLCWTILTGKIYWREVEKDE
jgi:hypothetical protein